MPLPPLSPSEAPRRLVVAFPRLHVSRLVSHWCTRRLPGFVSGGVACSASQLCFTSAPATAALHSSQTWMCVLFDSTERSAGQPP